ncbi:MAG: hypothetical protein M3069_25160 [Chloroflexota bacterium]|nr:hypothetical protein [Chloroflexota bacterium]
MTKSTEPRFPNPPVGSVEVPDDVRAELDAEERRMQAEPVLASTADEVPEDVLSEHDREARLASEEIRQGVAEGRPPAEEEPRS